MTDISEHLPKQSQTVEAIFAHYQKVGNAKQPRSYLGASIIGHPCERYLWYMFRVCCKPNFDGRMYRLFDHGNWEEQRFIADLKAIGCEVHSCDESGRQFSVRALGDHFGGHMDGCALGIPEAPKTWHVLEFKTHNAKSFAKLVKEGVKAAKPQHYAQVMVYMHLSGMSRALYLAVNKDMDNLYSERIHYDKNDAKWFMDKAHRIIFSTVIPERISDRQDWYECRYCDARDICWGSSESALPIPSPNCRQCCHATPNMAGNAHWVCERHKRGISESDQACACEDHLVLPGLISFAQPVDSDGDWIDFQEHDGDGETMDDIWRHGKGGFSTKELMSLPVSALTNPTLAKAKDLFGATVERVTKDDILSRYPESDSRIVWRGPLSQLSKAWLYHYKEDMEKLEPIAKFDELDYKAAEFSGGRVAIVWNKNIDGKQAEIREGIQ